MVLILRGEFRSSIAAKKNLGFRLNHGTRVYAFAYNDGRLEKVQTSKNGLYHFLLVVSA